jgi:hypothetical protein
MVEHWSPKPKMWVRFPVVSMYSDYFSLVYLKHIIKRFFDKIKYIKKQVLDKLDSAKESIIIKFNQYYTNWIIETNIINYRSYRLIQSILHITYKFFKIIIYLLTFIIDLLSIVGFIFFKIGVISSNSMEPLISTYSIVLTAQLWPYKVINNILKLLGRKNWLNAYLVSNAKIVNYYAQDRKMYIFHQIADYARKENSFLILDRPTYVKYVEHRYLREAYHILGDIVNLRDISEIYLLTLCKNVKMGKFMLYFLIFKPILITLAILNLIYSIYIEYKLVIEARIASDALNVNKKESELINKAENNEDEPLNKDQTADEDEKYIEDEDIMGKFKVQ